MASGGLPHLNFLSKVEGGCQSLDWQGKPQLIIEDMQYQARPRNLFFQHQLSLRDRGRANARLPSKRLVSNLFLATEVGNPIFHGKIGWQLANCHCQASLALAWQLPGCQRVWPGQSSNWRPSLIRRLPGHRQVAMPIQTFRSCSLRKGRIGLATLAGLIN